MSNRRDEFKGSTNPAEVFLKWNSTKKSLEFYDKEAKEKVYVDIPFKFLTLMQLSTVKGWNDATESGIYSNEVKNIGTDSMHVRSFKGNEIAKGLYSDIKDRVKAEGGHYVQSIYIMLSDGRLANLSLKGKSIMEWGDFLKVNRSRISDEWIVIDSFKTDQKGAIEYTYPEFKFSSSLSSDDAIKADDAYEVISTYMSEYLNQNSSIDDDHPAGEHITIDGEEEDDLPF